MLGLDVSVHRSGADALPAALMGVDLIVSDFAMPGMNGLEFAKALRERGVRAPIVMLSANPSEVRGKPGAEDLAAILQQPILRRDLFQALDRLAPPEPDRAAVPETPPAQPKMRILAAEDNRTNQLVLRKMLKDLDIELTFAANGIEAVEAYRAARPDFIFMDISMPEMDGKEATRRIRAIEADKGLDPVPICALTAHAMEGDAKDILAAGLDYYLTKPIKKAPMVEKILAHLPEGVVPVLPLKI